MTFNTFNFEVAFGIPLIYKCRLYENVILITINFVAFGHKVFNHEPCHFIYFQLSGFTLCIINLYKDRVETPHSILLAPCKLQMPTEEQFYGWRVLKLLVCTHCLRDIEMNVLWYRERERDYTHANLEWYLILIHNKIQELE